MIVKYTYPIVGEIFLPEHWPITWDRYRVTWAVNEGRAESITVAVRTSDLSCLPRVEQGRDPRIAADISIGHQPFHDEVESILRTACGLLGFFSSADVDCDRPTIAWEAETPEEEAKLAMASFSIGVSQPQELMPISFDLVARCFLSAIPLSEKEIVLRFMAKGRRDLRAERYIDAFYNFFFFFETQFAPGVSNPRRVRERFEAAPELTGSLKKAREHAAEEIGRVRRMADLLKLSDASLIEHLILTRGRLHHHALPRKEGAWHPEKHGEFEAEARFLSLLAEIVSQGQCMPFLFNEATDKQIREVTAAEGVAYTFIVEADGVIDPSPAIGLPELRISMPCGRPSHMALATLEEELRREGAPYDQATVRGYTVKSSDGAAVLARYQNFTVPKRSN